MGTWVIYADGNPPPRLIGRSAGRINAGHAPPGRRCPGRGPFRARVRHRGNRAQKGPHDIATFGKTLRRENEWQMPCGSGGSERNTSITCSAAGKTR